MENYKGYWISGSAIPSSPYTSRCWYAHGIVLKSRPNGFAVEVARIQDDGFAFEMKALVNWYGMELCRLAVDHCLPLAVDKNAGWRARFLLPELTFAPFRRSSAMPVSTQRRFTRLYRLTN